MKNEFVFKEVSGDLVYVGDFDGLYKSEADPWGQSASSDAPMDLFYRRSREMVASIIESMAPRAQVKVLEVGCGHGHSTQALVHRLPMAEVVGVDISNTAITEAKKIYPSLQFMHGDIRDKNNTLPNNQEVVLLHQMLWYVLDDLQLVLENCRSLLKATDTSFCLISQAFPREQRYGKNVLDGYEGAVKYFKNIPAASLVHSTYTDLSHLPHIDCHFALKFQ